MPGIAIVGIAETPATRRSEYDLRTLTMNAVRAAIADAGLTAADIDGIVTDALIMPSTVPHDWVAGQLGIERLWDAAMSYGGAGTVGAPLLARLAIEQGLATNVLCYFGVDWGTRAGGPYAFHGHYPAKRAFEMPVGFNAQPVYFAMAATRYAYEYGLTPEQQSALPIGQRANSIRTGRGQNTTPLTFEDYMRAPVASEPLRYPDCCLISDGAVAYVMTSAERATDTPHPPVYVRGVGFGASPIPGEDAFTQKDDVLSLPGTDLARRRVEADAGIAIGEVDFAELYDCFTISCLLQLEDLGFCGRGEAAAFVADGNVALDGRLPVNTHGGLLSYSYVLAADHLVEAVRQLRGEAGAVQVPDAELGLVTGLSHPDYAALMLSV